MGFQIAEVPDMGPRFSIEKGVAASVGEGLMLFRPDHGTLDTLSDSKGWT